MPDNYVGDVMGDLNKRRGRVMGMNPTEDGNQILEAEVPMAEMTSYAIDLRSLTQSRGSFSFHFVRYEEAPPAAQQKAIDDASHPLLQVGAEVQEGPFATGEDFIYEITCVREPSPVYQATHEGMLPCFTEYKNAKVTLTPPDGVVFLITNPQGGYDEVDGPFTYTFNNTLEATGSSSSFQIRARMKDNVSCSNNINHKTSS